MSEQWTRWATVEGSAKTFPQTMAVGPHKWTADEPVEKGGTDTGPEPFEILSSALGACTSLTLGIYARNKGLPLDHVRVRVRHGKAPAPEGTGTVDVLEREIELTGDLTEDQRKRLLEIAEKCPVHKALTRGVSVRSKLV
ncbi:MAG: OsmC family protein [Polyangiaceae bacterium]|nr:OsmC family protein [Polyangiaceae bacterium]